jgi:hypothetical protein
VPLRVDVCIFVANIQILERTLRSKCVTLKPSNTACAGHKECHDVNLQWLSGAMRRV